MYRMLTTTKSTEDWAGGKRKRYRAYLSTTPYRRPAFVFVHELSRAYQPSGVRVADVVS